MSITAVRVQNTRIQAWAVERTHVNQANIYYNSLMNYSDFCRFRPDNIYLVIKSKYYNAIK